MALGGNSPKCPSCGRPMVLRTARKGRFAGRQFYGCSGYPYCKQTLDFDQAPFENSQSKPDSFPVRDFEIPQSSPQKDNKILEFPQTFECQPISSNFQVKVFQNIAAPFMVVRQLNRKRNKIDRQKVNAFSQWRLDFPAKKESPSSEFVTPISVIEKIFLRGSIVPCSPGIETFLSNSGFTDIESANNFLSLVQRSENHPRNFFIASNFDSDEEQAFYSNLISHMNSPEKIYPWVFSQVAISNLIPLTLNEMYPPTQQRVDFLLNHPKGGKLIVEIDGPQHESSVQADKRRDSLLASNGFKVVRIKTMEESLINPFQNRELSNFIQAIESTEILDLENNPYLEILLLVKFSFQFQIALLEALKGGWLPLHQDSSWNLLVTPPSFLINQEKWNQIISIALEDFITIFQKAVKLFSGIELKIKTNLSFGSKSKTNPQINISYNPYSNTRKNSVPIFKISDVFLPFKIAQPVPLSKSCFIENPQKEIVKFFLKFIFQKEDFLDGQWEAIRRTLQGKDSIVLLPTGGGKTIAFQLASFLLPGICLVIDPLIALINDQIDNLCDYGIDRAVGISSQLSLEERNAALDSFSRGQFFFCYITPERLQMKDFRSSLRAVTAFSPINLVSIDEAHCVSEWGHDFRVAYLNIARNARNYCEKDGTYPPIIGLTGTASRSVLRDIRRELEITSYDSLITPKNFDRKELHFHVFNCHSNEKHSRLLGILSSLPGFYQSSQNSFFSPNGDSSNTGLIFFPHVNGEFGIIKGFDLVRSHFGEIVGLYSGGSPKEVEESHWDEMKSLFADNFKNNDITILSCTNAFGMGIDKPNIRFTVHMNLPRSIEAFYQEAGRAGRDRKDSQCFLILSNDFPNRTKSILNPSKSLEEVHQIIEGVSYAENDDITRALYFHVNTFKGAKEELYEVESLINKIGDLFEEKIVKIPFVNDSKRVLIEKAIHRLVIIGVIQDYTVNYSSKEFELKISGKNSDENLDSYIRYIGNYDKKLADQAFRVASKKLSLSHKDFVVFLAGKLIHDFIYNIIELSRRRSLNEMLQACLADPSDAGIRSRILSYLELSHFSDILDSARETPENLSEIISQLADEVDSAMEANELRGQTARMLEAYPNNPAFLLIRAFAEALSYDRSNEVVFENFKAFLSFSIAQSGWGMDPVKIALISSTFLDKLPSNLLDLAQDLFISFLEEFEFDLKIARLFVKHTNEGISFFASHLLLKNLKERINQFCNH